MSESSQLSYNQFLLKKQQILMSGLPELPTDFEVIVVGTGLEESIIAAALARNGHNVLHIDTKDYYGEDWASFNFRALQEWITSHSDTSENQSTDSKEDNEKSYTNLLKEGEKLHLLDKENSIKNVKETWYCPEDENVDTTEENEKSEFPKWTKSRVLEEGNKFNIDLTSRLLYSRGSMVDLLIQSNISRYTEFKSVSRVLTVLNGEIEYVPSSRADVFSTKHVTVVEKRILMQFLKFCIEYENHPEAYENYVNRSYHDFLKHKKLTDNLIHFVVHSIAMVEPCVNTLEGLKATQKFLSSLGRFGNTPFLYSSFGSGELPQAYCRLCAVFGGTYYLGRSIEAIITDASGNGNCVGIISNGLRINCQKLVMRGQTCPPDLKQVNPSKGSQKQPVEVIERKICLATESILPSEKEQLTFLSVPPKKSDDATDEDSKDSYTYVTEAGHGAAVCPRGMYCLHLTKAKKDNQTIQDSFETIVPANKKDSLLWSLDFNIVTENFQALDSKPETEQSLFLTSGPHFELDYDITIANAKDLYAKMFPEEPFLPRAPDPEEIILGEPSGEDEVAQAAPETDEMQPPPETDKAQPELEKNSSNCNEGDSSGDAEGIENTTNSMPESA